MQQMTDTEFRTLMEGKTATYVKLFDFQDIGQVLIHKVNHTKDNKVGLKTVVNYNGNYFSQDTKFPNDEAGQDDRDELFDRIDERMAYGQGRSVMCELITMLHPNGLPKVTTQDIII